MSDDHPVQMPSFLMRPRMSKSANEVADQLQLYIEEAHRVGQGLAVMHAGHLDAKFAVLQRAQAVRDAETNPVTRKYMQHLIQHTVELMSDSLDEVASHTDTSISDHLAGLRRPSPALPEPQPKDTRSFFRRVWEAGS